MASTSVSWATDVANVLTHNCRPHSEGCVNCYAERISRSFDGEHSFEKEFRGFPILRQDAAEIVRKLRKNAARVFFNDMSDSFYRSQVGKGIEQISDQVIHRMFQLMDTRRDCNFLVLTKRADRMASMTDLIWSDHIWAGVSVESPKHAYRIEYLRRTNAKHRFVSLEPALMSMKEIDLTGIDWVIMGGESGPHHRHFDKQWAREVRDKCTKLKIPFFFKQSSHDYPDQDYLLDGVEVREIPDALMPPPEAVQVALF